MLLRSCDAKTVDKDNSDQACILVKVTNMFVNMNNQRRIIFLSLASKTFSSNASPAPGGEMASSNAFAMKRP